MKIISFQEIIDCNALLKERGLHFKVHLRDACGKQSCWIEPLEEHSGEKDGKNLYEVLEEYFGERKLPLEFDEEKQNFWVK